MGLHRNMDENQYYTDYDNEESLEEKHHHRQVRLMLEARLERKRLRDEIEDEFDWSEHDLNRDLDSL